VLRRDLSFISHGEYIMLKTFYAGKTTCWMLVASGLPLTFLDNGLSPRSMVVMRITRFVKGSLADFPICHVVTPLRRGKGPLSTQLMEKPNYKM